MMTNQEDSLADLQLAERQMAMYGISAYVYRAWRSQRNSAADRGIPFRFTLFQWHCWWNAELAKLGPTAVRGKRKGQFMMCRFGDQGAYEYGNVYPGTPKNNANDVPIAVRRRITERVTATRTANGNPRGAHLAVRGDGHPRSRAVMTPKGRFGSIALAAEAFGITRAGGYYRAERGEWRYC